MLRRTWKEYKYHMRAHTHTLNLRSSRTLLSVGSLSLSLWWVRHRTLSSLETDCGQFPALISQITCIRQVKYLNRNKITGKEAGDSGRSPHTVSRSLCRGLALSVMRYTHTHTYARWKINSGTEGKRCL